MASEYAYETSGPQWVDLQAMTPNHDNLSSDDFFDRSHDSLEATPVKQKLRSRKSKKQHSQSITEKQTPKTPRMNNSKSTKLQCTFMNDIDNICITPLKLTSPGDKEPVLTEMTVNEILNEAMEGMKLASSLKKRPKPKNMNKTVCPMIEITADTPTRKVVRLSKSVNTETLNQSHQMNRSQEQYQPLTEKAMNTRRSTRIQNLKSAQVLNTPGKINKSQVITGNILENDKVPAAELELIENTKENIENQTQAQIPKDLRKSLCPSSFQTTSTIKRKIRLSRSVHQSTPVNRTPVFNIRTSPCTMKLQPSKIPVYKLEDEVDKCEVQQEKDVKEIPVVVISSDEDDKQAETKLGAEVDPQVELKSQIEEKAQKEIVVELKPQIEEKPQKEIDVELKSQIEEKSQKEIVVAKPQVEAKSQVEVPQVDQSEDEYNEEELPNINEVKDHQEINIPDMEPQSLNDNAIEQEFQPFDVFSKTLDEQDEEEKAFKVHKSKHVEKRLPATKRSTILSGQARRNSIYMKQIVSKRRLNKYISLAEGVSAFQRNTPTRFHTLSKKNEAATKVNEQKKPQRTIPVSPAWHSKTRAKKTEHHTQNNKVINTNLKKPQKLPRPVPSSPIAAPKVVPKTPKEVPKRHITIPKPFNLTQPKKSTAPVSSSTSTASSHVKHPKLSKPKKVMVLTTENGQLGKPQEILHFGIPTTRDFNVSSRLESKKKTTQPVPFSMEERTKKLMSQKEQKLKKLQEDTKKKPELARPAPTSAKKAPAKEQKDDRQSEKLQKVYANLKVKPFSFEGRDKLMAKKREELRKKVEEEAKKARVFHANPAPHFKPVSIRVPSRENVAKTGNKSLSKLNEHNNVSNTYLRTKSADQLSSMLREKSKDNLKISNIMHGVSVDCLKNRQKSKDNLQIKNASTVTEQIISLNEQNGDERVPNMPALKPKLIPLSIELHSEKRARLRKEYEEKLKIKMEQDEARRKRELEVKMAVEQAEIAQMRKKAEHKARPVPVYKPLVIVKSSRPITDPQSPAWASKR